MQSKHIVSFTILFSLFCQKGISQAGESQVFSFLNVPSHARVMALGGGIISVNDNDIDLTYYLPSLINENNVNKLSISYVGYLSDVKSGMINYGFKVKDWGTFIGSLHYMSYGTIKEMDYLGSEIGEISASDYCLNLGWSKKIFEGVNLGLNFKNVFSNFYQYKSYGIAFDISGTYNHSSNLFSTSILFKNIGYQVISYDGINENLPFRIQWGLSKKFEHAPIRILAMLNDIQKWDLKGSSSIETNSSFSNEEVETSEFYNFGDNALRHLALGIELAPGKENFMIRLGYNYRRQQELKIASKAGFTGFSIGMGLRTKYFQFAYTRATYHLAGGTNTITLSTDLNVLF